jgi:hypothetical protein
MRFLHFMIVNHLSKHKVATLLPLSHLLARSLSLLCYLFQRRPMSLPHTYIWMRPASLQLPLRNLREALEVVQLRKPWDSLKKVLLR